MRAKLVVHSLTSSTWIAQRSFTDTHTHYRCCLQLRTRSRVAFAPFIRGVLISFSLLFLGPAIFAVVMASVEEEDDEDEYAKRALPLVFQAWSMSTGFALFFAYSTPKGKQAAEDGFVVGVALTNAALATTAHVLLDELTTSACLELALFSVGSSVPLLLMRVTRAYIAMHSDAHIEEHLIKSAAAIGGLLGPAIFLFAETFSCYTFEEDDFEVACRRLNQSNTAVSFHLICSAVFYLGTGIMYRHVSMNEILSLRNVDAGFVVRGLLQSLAWVLAMVMFGSRPRDAPVESETEVILTWIAGGMRYILFLIWAVLGVWEFFHTKHKVHTDLVLSGEREEDEGGGGGLTQRWAKVWGGLNEYVKSRAVDGEKARVSPLYSRVALTGAWLLSAVPAVVALVAVLVLGKDSNVAFLFCELIRSVEYVAAPLFTAYMLLDLEPDRRVAGIHTYVLAVAACINVVVAIVLGGSIGFGVAGALAFMCFGRFMGGVRLKASAHPVEEERREHVNTACSAILRLLAPLIVMSSEVAWCWLKAYLESGEGEGALMKEDRRCGGIYFGCDGLMKLIAFAGLLPMLTVNAKSTLTLKNMCKFNLSIIEAVQVGALGVFSVYAMGYYATRKERVVYDAETLIKGGLLSMITVAFVVGFFLKKGADSEDGENVASRPSSGSVTSDRFSVGAERSVWEGGMMGAKGMGRIKRASTRGIAIETEWRDENVEEEGEDEATFSPGMM